MSTVGYNPLLHTPSFLGRKRPASPLIRVETHTTHSYSWLQRYYSNWHWGRVYFGVECTRGSGTIDRRDITLVKPCTHRTDSSRWWSDPPPGAQTRPHCWQRTPWTCTRGRAPSSRSPPWGPWSWGQVASDPFRCRVSLRDSGRWALRRRLAAGSIWACILLCGHLRSANRFVQLILRYIN